MYVLSAMLKSLVDVKFVFNWCDDELRVEGERCERWKGQRL